MKKIKHYSKHLTLLFIIAFISLPSMLFAQETNGRVVQRVLDAKIQSHDFKQMELFPGEAVSARQGFANTIRDGLVFDLDQQAVRAILREEPRYMSMELPFQGGTKIELELIRVNIFNPGFTITTSDGRDVTSEVELGEHYRGMIAGDPGSLVGISVFENEVVGFISHANQNYELVKIKDSQNSHVLYRTQDLLDDYDGFTCETVDDSDSKPYSPQDLVYNGQRDVGDCVALYVEAANNVYTTFGSVLSDAINFVNAMFAESFVFFDNDGIDFYLSDMFIWTTDDPYDSTGQGGDQLTLFQSNTGAFNGDLAHLIEITPGGGSRAGGIAAGFSGLCNGDPDESKCYTGMRSTSYNNIPTYTRNMKVVLHEMVHLLGSRHTHACVWNGDNTQIDDCGNQDAFTDGDAWEGQACFDTLSPILPGAGGGYLMSYCDRSPFTGVNFSLGLHPQVLAVVLNNIENAGCLSADCCTNDSAEPTALCQDVTVELDVNGDGSVSALDIDDGSLDACGDITYDVNGMDAVSVDCDDVGSQVMTLTVTDESGNQNSCTANVEVQDNIAPDAVCQDISVYLDFEVCTVSITANDVDGGSSDACGIQSLAIDKDFFDTDDVGDNIVTLTVTDVNGNVSDCEATVTVLKRPTTLTNLGDFDGQYSDYPVLSAQLIDDLTGNPLVGRTITFDLGPENHAAVTDGAGIASVTFRLGFEFPPTALGFNYTVESAYAGDDCYEPSDDSDVFTVLQEDARVTYTGKNFASTESAQSGEAKVLLSATVCDITNTPDAAGDSDPGSVANATVTFVDRNGGPISPPLTVVPLPGDTTKGTVVYEWVVNIGMNECVTFDVGIVVGNYYLRDNAADDQEITICKPDKQFVTGGGFIILENSFGTLPGDDASHCNFGYNSSFKGRNKEISGEMNIIYRRTEVDGLHEYQIKSLDVASLGVDADNDFAEFCGKAELNDVTDPDNPINIIAEAMFIVKMKDYGNPGQDNDLIGFALYANEGGLIFSSRWNGTKTVMQTLDGGNLTVHSQGNNMRDIAQIESADERILVTGINAVAYPNPFSDQVRIDFILNEAGPTTIEVITAFGKVVTAVDLGVLDGELIHTWKFNDVGLLSSGSYLYRIVSGSEVTTGSLIMIK